MNARALVLLAALSLSGCVSSWVRGIGGGASDELRANGVPADASILEIWDTGWTINNDPVIGMKVEVRPEGRAPFEATIARTTVSRIALPQFQPGRVVPVLFDPKNPAEIAVDFEGARAARGPAGRGILGVAVRPLNEAEKRRLGREDGIAVEAVVPGSPAEEAGVLRGDVIVAVDGRPLPDVRAVPELVASLAGRTVAIDVLRHGRPVSLTARLEPAP